MDSTGSSGITRPITKVSNNSPSRVSTTLTARCAAARSIGWLKNANTETSPSNSDAGFGMLLVDIAQPRGGSRVGLVVAHFPAHHHGVHHLRNRLDAADFGVVQPLRLPVVGHLPGFVALDLGLADQL